MTAHITVLQSVTGHGVTCPLVLDPQNGTHVCVESTKPRGPGQGHGLSRPFWEKREAGRSRDGSASAIPGQEKAAGSSDGTNPRAAHLQRTFSSLSDISALDLQLCQRLICSSLVREANLPHIRPAALKLAQKVTVGESHIDVRGLCSRTDARVASSCVWPAET